MEKNLLLFTRRLGIILSILCCILSCQKELDPLPEEPKPKPEEPLANPIVEAARQFHKSHDEPLVTLFNTSPSPASRSTRNPTIRWEESTVKEDKSQVSVYTPLSTGGVDSVVLKINQEQTSRSKKVPVTSRLVVRKNKQLNFTHQYLASTIQLTPPGSRPTSRDSVGTHTLTLEYNTKHQLISIYENKNGKFRLMTLAKENEPYTETYEVELNDTIQKIVPFSSMYPALCPYCNSILAGRVCEFHGYILEEVDVDGDLNRTLRNICNQIQNVIEQGIGYHWRIHICTGFCTTREDQIRELALECLQNYLPTSELFALAWETQNFTRPWLVFPIHWDRSMIYAGWSDLLHNLSIYSELMIHDIAMRVYEYEQANQPVNPGGGSGGPGEGGGSGGPSEGGGPGGSGDPGSPQNPKDSIPLDKKSKYTATLTTSAKSVLLRDSYTLTYKINTSDPVNIVSSEVWMTRAHKNNWTYLDDIPQGQSTFTRQAITPGHWEATVEIIVLEDGVEKQVPVKSVFIEEMFPPLDTIMQHLDLEQKAVELWNIAVNIARENQYTHTVREVGCFIYFDTGTGEYSFGEHILGDPVQLVEEVMATVHFQWNDRFLDPQTPYRYEVAALHSHYPLTWAAPNFQRSPGPSDADEAFLLPGIVYDYTHEVRTGYDPDCYSKKFYPYGPSQRQTPNL